MSSSYTKLSCSYYLAKEQNHQNDNGDADESDDEAPEDVPFSMSKNSALTLLKATEKSQIEAKNLKKKRRQQNEALLQKQKEEKEKRLQVLASKRLPEDLLDNLHKDHDEKHVQQSTQKLKKGKHHHFSETDISSSGRIFQPIISVIQYLKSFLFPFQGEHYIALNTDAAQSSTTFNVAVLQSKKWKNKLSKPGSNISQDFREKALFNPHIKRVPST